MEGSVTMEIQITRTIEYTIDVADDDTVTLNRVQNILRREGVEGDYLADMIQEVYRTDIDTVLAALVVGTGLADTASEEWVVDLIETGGLEHPFAEPEDVEDDEPATQALTLA